MAAIRLSLTLPAHFLDTTADRAGFIVLAAFLISFLFIRTSARLMRSPKVPWWPGSVTTDSGVHLHHLVWGIMLLLLSGFLSFVVGRDSPWTEILAAGFGVGAGLTLDEFALWVYLRDVYWAEEGRASFDAVVIAALLGGLVVAGLAPFDLPNKSSSVDALLVAVAIDVLFAALVILKGKLILGLVGVFFPPVSIIGALRLAAPTSAWARWFYGPDSRRRARAKSRWNRIESRRTRIADLIAGTPSEPVPEAPSEESGTLSAGPTESAH